MSKIIRYLRWLKVLNKEKRERDSQFKDICEFVSRVNIYKRMAVKNKIILPEKFNKWPDFYPNSEIYLCELKKYINNELLKK